MQSGAYTSFTQIDFITYAVLFCDTPADTSILFVFCVIGYSLEI